MSTAISPVTTTPTCLTLTDREAAPILGVSVYTLRKWRCTGTGPAYVKLGRKTVRYRLADLQAYTEQQVVSR